MKLELLFEAIDKVNDQDPRKLEIDGKETTHERVYSLRMLKTLLEFEPSAPDDLQIACYAQHIGRWQLPRDTYPLGRAGYNGWRRAQYEHQSSLASKTLKNIGATDELTASVKELVAKKDRTTNPLSQALEDVACLVFVKYYAESFFEKHSKEKSISIVQKTWKKMSNKAQKHLLHVLEAGYVRTVIESALAKV